MREFETEVRRVPLALRPGEVVTYGEMAAEAGFPGAARAVSNVLRNFEGLPWRQVVNSIGRLVPSHNKEHAELLRSEGVMVKNGRVEK